MAIFLNENEIGSDAELIGFPHLVLCGGVVVAMSTGMLVGAHVSDEKLETAVLHALRQKTLEVGGLMERIYLIAELKIHLAYGMKDIKGKAKAIGFSGPGYVVDTGVLKPTDGTYAQVQSNGAGAEATVRFRLNQQMDYTDGLGPQIYKIGRPTYGTPGASARRNQNNAMIVTAIPKNNRELKTPHVKSVVIA